MVRKKSSAASAAKTSPTKADSASVELEAPNWLLMAMEGLAAWEFGASLIASPFLHQGVKGDGHPVLVFPGLGAGDVTTLMLRNFLRDHGYASYAWLQGLNLGPRPGVVEACVERLHEIRAEHGCKVSLIGWSLGGIYARELAKQAPDAVRQVITLGTPFAGHPKATNAWRFYELASGHKDIDAAQLAQIRTTPPVPTTSIYSRTDGVVAWRCSLEQESAQSENLAPHHRAMQVNKVLCG